MIDILSEEMRRNPYPVYEQLRATSPVLQIPQGDLWLILDYDGVKFALNDHEAFSNDVSPAKGVKFEWLLFFDPPRHTKTRGIIMQAFTPGMIANLEPRIREFSSRVLDEALYGDFVDLAAEFSSPLPAMVISEMMGMPLSDLPMFKRWSDAILDLSYTIAGGEQMRQASLDFLTANSEMRDYLQELVADRNRSSKDDLLSRLVEAEVDGERLTEDELLRFFQLLIVAGTETTTNLINNALLCFMENPEQLALLREDPGLITSAIEEVLRYRSPLQAAFRATNRDVELHGRTIPAGRFVLAMVGSANRDQSHFSEPNKFDIKRDPNPHIAFGHGIHFCLGAALSRLEARIALPDFLSRVKHFELDTDEPLKPRKAFHVHGPSNLPLGYQRK
jgi:cytochrome P450